MVLRTCSGKYYYRCQPEGDGCLRHFFILFLLSFLVESLLSGRFQIISPGFRRKKICPKQSPLFYCSVKNKSRGLTLHKEKNTSHTS